jgi:hypothetical protein
MTPATFPGTHRAFPALTAGALLAWSTIGGSKVAHAYTISSIATTGCHEQITTDALRAVRLTLASAAPLPAELKGVPFSYPQYRATIGFEFYSG